ncbi:MAG: hypothetical protein ACI8RD_011899, partial [Bacillariaceae sp.]|jgi:hypothetical protein
VSVLSGKFDFYPCPLEMFTVRNNALEVRYVRSSCSQKWHMTSFLLLLEYDQDETIQYVQNKFNMEEDMAVRLKPDILVNVDPQMFWSSVLHSNAQIMVLKKLPECPGGLIKEYCHI